MKIERFGVKLGMSAAAAVLASIGLVQVPVLAQDGHVHTAASSQPQTAESIAATNALVDAVRAATVQFKDFHAALAAGFTPKFGCVTGSSEGAMGVHFLHLDQAGNLVPPVTTPNELDVANPQILLYEPLPGGGFQLTGADYIIFKDAWDPKNHVGDVNSPVNTPILMGQIFHLFDAPNRFGLPAFYTLHVWAWKANPQGTVANWNPNVSCDAFNPGAF